MNSRSVRGHTTRFAELRGQSQTLRAKLKSMQCSWRKRCSIARLEVNELVGAGFLGVSRFCVGKCLFGVHIKSAQVKHDRVAEVLTIAIAAVLRLDLLDLRIHRFAQGIGCLQHDCVDDSVLQVFAPSAPQGLSGLSCLS